MKFLWLVLLAFFTVFGQKAAVPARAPVTPAAVPFDTAGFKLRQDVESLRKEIQLVNAQNKDILAIGQKSSDHVDNTLLGIFGLFIVIGVLGWRASAKEASNLSKGVHLEVKESVEAGEKALAAAISAMEDRNKKFEVKQTALIDQLDADHRQGLTAIQKSLDASHGEKIDKEYKDIKEELVDLVGQSSRENRDIKLAHQLFRMNVYLKIDKPKHFCEAANEYYINALGLGDHGEMSKAYEDVVDPIRVFISVYIRKNPSIKQAHIEILRKIITAIGAHLESDPTKILSNLDKIKPLKVFEFGNKENVWEHWLVDDLDIIMGVPQVAAAIEAENAEETRRSE